MPSLLSLLGLAWLLLNLLPFTLAQSPTGCYSLRTLPDKATKISSMEPFVCMDHCGKDTLALIGPFPHDPFNFYCGCSNYLPSTPASTSCNLVCPGASIPTLKSPCGGYTNGIEAWSGYVYGELAPSPVPSPSPPPVQTPPEIGALPLPTTAAATSPEAPVPPPSNDAVASSSVADPIPGPITSSAASSSASLTVQSVSPAAAVSNSSTVLIQSASGSTIPTSAPMAAAVDSGTNSNIAIISACMGVLIVLVVLCLGVHCWRRQRQSRFKNNTPQYGYRDESEFGDGAALFNAHHSGSRFNSSKRSEDSRQRGGLPPKRLDGHEGDSMSRFLHGYKAGLQQAAQVHRQESSDPQVVYVLPYEGSVLVSKKSKTFTAAGPAAAAGQWEKVPRFMPSNTKLGAMTVVLQPNGDVEDANRFHAVQNEDFKNPQALHKDYRLWSGDVIASSIRTAATSVFSMEDKFTNSGNGQTHSVADSSIFMHHAAKNAVLDLEGAKLLSKQQQQQQQQTGAAVVIEPVQ
ncbi:hypothetical protein BJ741DRAFT_600119 [Chytriomyces cf. hyalinus JEL632]|nr:hypothetical protein BJ741DRAFT_600119 [Chytriomyces cf. hyalinus JEL632]